MEKKILSEINRTREIMGLGELLIKEFVKETTGRILTEQEVSDWNVDMWIPTVLQDNREDFWKWMKSYDFDDMKYGKSQVTLAKAIAHAYEKIYDEPLTLDSLHVYQPGFLSPLKLKYANEVEDSAFGGVDIMVLSNPPGSTDYKVTMTFGPLGWDETEVKLSEAIMKMNQYNIVNAGTQQIIRVKVDIDSYKKQLENRQVNQYHATSLVNQLVVKTDMTHDLVLFSVDKESVSLGGEEGGTLQIAGDVVKIPGDQLFADVAVKPNDAVVKDAIAKLVEQSQGKKVKTIKIHSSASNDTIKNTKTFTTNLPQYKNWTDAIIQATDTEGTFTEQDLKSNPTGNRALAYMRGQNVGASLKNVESLKNADIEYLYEIGGSGDDNQFANLEIMAMEDPKIEVLKGGTNVYTTKKIGRADNTYYNHYDENMVSVYKARIHFDDATVTRDEVAKKKIWPPSEWFKSKESRTTQVDKPKLIQKREIEKTKQQSGEL